MFESIAYAANAAPAAAASNPLLGSMAPFFFIFAIFYFLLIRPQQKRQKELTKLITDLKKGDRVITAGGIIGDVAGIQDDYVVLKVGENENTKMEVLKSSITGLRS